MEKELKSFDVEFKATDRGIIEGYGAFFNNVDSYNDVIVQGAFKNSIGNVADIKLFFNHDWSGVPIGTVTNLYEDERGLKFEAQLNDTTLAKDVKEAIKTGAIKKMSIGYSTIDSEFDKDKGIRYLKDIKLFEISPVNFPANDMADIQSYKSEQFKKQNDELAEKLLKGFEVQFNEIKNSVAEVLGILENTQVTIEDAKKMKEQLEKEEKDTGASQIMAKMNDLFKK